MRTRGIMVAGMLGASLALAGCQNCCKEGWLNSGGGATQQQPKLQPADLHTPAVNPNTTAANPTPPAPQAFASGAASTPSRPTVTTTMSPMQPIEIPPAPAPVAADAGMSQPTVPVTRTTTPMPSGTVPAATVTRTAPMPAQPEAPTSPVMPAAASDVNAGWRAVEAPRPAAAPVPAAQPMPAAQPIAPNAAPSPLGRSMDVEPMPRAVPPMHVEETRMAPAVPQGAATSEIHEATRPTGPAVEPTMPTMAPPPPPDGGAWNTK